MVREAPRKFANGIIMISLGLFLIITVVPVARCGKKDQLTQKRRKSTFFGRLSFFVFMMYAFMAYELAWIPIEGDMVKHHVWKHDL